MFTMSLNGNVMQWGKQFNVFVSQVPIMANGTVVDRGIPSPNFGLQKK